MAERDPFDDRGDSDPVTDYRPDLTGPQNLADRISQMPGILQDILITHFASPERIFFKSLRGLVWHPDEQRRQIVIENFCRWDPRKAGSKPSIVVNRGDAQSETLGIMDQEITPGPNNVSGMSFIRQWVCSVDIVVCDASGLRADELAGEVRQHLQAFSSRIALEYCLNRFEVKSLSRLGKPELFKSMEGAKDLFGTQIAIQYTLSESWELIPEAPLIEAASIVHNLE